MNRPSYANRPFLWASAGQRVAATTGKVASGFRARERLAAQCLNDALAREGLWSQVVADLVFQPVSATGLTVTVNAAAGTFTRSAGDYLQDGLAVGQHVTWSGFAAAGNNVNRRLISGLSPTVMTFADTSELVNVTDDAGCSVEAFGEISGRFYAGGPAYIDDTLEVADALLVSDDITYVDEHHSDRELVISPIAFNPTAGSPAFSSSPEPTWTASGADFLYAVVELPKGMRLKSASVATTRASGTITVEIYNHSVQTGALALIGASLAISSGTTRAVTAVSSVSGDGDALLEAGESIIISVALGANLNKLHGVILTFDRP